MAAPTKEEMLETVEIAISALSAGVKSYSISGRTVTYNDISELKNWRTQLKREIAGRKSNTTYARFDNPE